MVRVRHLVVLSLAMSAFVAALPAASAEATFPGKNGQIAYAVFATQNPDIAVVNPNGTHAVNITRDEFIEEFPSWSPDGGKIAFAGSPGQPHTYQLLVMKADGTNRRQLTHLPGMSTWPSWSPDGSHLVFLYDENNDGSAEIYTIAADGSDLTPVTSTGTDHISPKWSPDGQRIAFSAQATSDRASDYDLYTSRPDGSDVRRVAALPDDQWQPDWSPDGKKLVFVTHRLVPGPRVDERPLYTIRPDGSGLARVGDADGYFPVWSPDGTRIAYAAWTFVLQPWGSEALYSDIATVKPDGTGFRYVVSERPNDIIQTEPSWQRLPTSKRDCLAGGWRNYGDRFRNQGECVAFVQHNRTP